MEPIMKIEIHQYQNQLLHSLYELQKNNVLCDVTLESNGGEIYVHQIVWVANQLLSADLNACCTELRKLQNKKERIDCTKYSLEIIEALVTLVYTGKIDIETKHAYDLLLSCDHLKLKTACQATRQHIDLIDKNYRNYDRCLGCLAPNDTYVIPVTSVEQPGNTDIPISVVDIKNKRTDDSVCESLDISEQRESYQLPVQVDIMKHETSHNKKRCFQLIHDHSKHGKGKNKSLEETSNNNTQDCESMETETEGTNYVPDERGDEFKEDTRNSCEKKDSEMTENVKIETEEESFHEIIDDNSSVVTMVTALNNINNQQGYICSFCGKNIKTKSGHRRHELIHSDNDKKRRECHVCNNKFHFLGHMNTHMVNKPFKCEKCKLQYAYKASYKRHLEVCKTPTAKTFKCSICPCIFERKDVLSDHMKGKHEKSVDQYRFEICNKGFRYRLSKSKHNKKYHQ
ncbi:KRAB [Mytilus edulis]|uniref:KRAB n=1 Tax=Mytilus edulis TaxID=6550 RepID=A0A8S3RH63_MYTED|nr:KRAB [Mytilus edulis]